jgi:hypothetical protein
VYHIDRDRRSNCHRPSLHVRRHSPQEDDQSATLDAAATRAGLGLRAEHVAAYNIPFFCFSPSEIEVILNETDPIELMAMIWKTLVYMTDNVQQIDHLGEAINRLYNNNNNSEEVKKRSHTIY